MELEDRATKFRAEVERLGLGKSGRPFPPAMRAEAVAILAARLRDGGTLAAVSKELGLPRTHTLTRWRQKSGGRTAAPTRPRLERVQVVDDEPRAIRGRVVVHGPHGLRIEGLDLPQLVDLLRRLT